MVMVAFLFRECVLFFLWYCVDDRLAMWLAMPSLGHVPWWIAFVLSLAILPLGGYVTDVLGLDYVFE
jgi:hypothetical protein